MKLYVGNKNYSSWSMRSWVLLRHFGIAFEEVFLRFDGFGPDSAFKRVIGALSPAGRVPVLLIDDLAVWDTLAIAETIAERFAQHPVWPRDPAARARARSLCAEMHAGFGALRSACPMNIELQMPAIGPRAVATQPDVRADLERLIAMWTDALRCSGGPFLFGAFGNADAYFAPVVARIRTYALPVPPQIAAYGERVWADAAVAQWVADALAERDFVAEDEPYRSSRDG